MSGPIQMRLKASAVLGNLSHRRETEDLVTPTVGQYRSVPSHETMQTAQLANQFCSRTKIKMIRVGEYNLATQLFQIPWQHCLHRGLCAHRHEGGGFDHAVGGHQTTEASVAYR